MRSVNLSVKACMIFCLWPSLILFCSCQDQNPSRLPPNKSSTSAVAPVPKGPQPIAAYIRNILQDREGNFWFGTNGKGVAHYDGTKVSYFSKAAGFNGEQITDIVEDSQGNLWFGTNLGVVQYDWTSKANGEKRFTNYIIMRDALPISSKPKVSFPVL